MKIKNMVIWFILLLFVFISPAIVLGESENLLLNAGFEEFTGNNAANWSQTSYDNSENAVEFKLESIGAHSGTACFSITNIKPNDSKIGQNIKIESGYIYNVSCWIKTENIKQQAGSANITLFNDIGIYTSKELSDTGNQWQKLDFYIKTPENFGTDLQFMLRLGGQGTLNQGTAYFDDISIEKVVKPKEGAVVESFFVPESKSAAPAAKSDSTSSNASKTVLFIILGCIALGLVVFVEARLSRKRKSSSGVENKPLKTTGNDIDEEEDEDDLYYDE